MNARDRYKLLTSLKDSTLTQRELVKCAQNPVYFIDTYIWTYDPRKSPSQIEFQLFPQQREYVYWLMERMAKKESGCVIKPRDIGASWVSASFALWLFIFRKGVSIGFCSRKLMYVDKKGAMDSLFGKIRYAIDHLPRFIRAHIDLDEKIGLLSNRRNGAEIKGEGGDNVGRGGRSTIYFADEYAYVEHQDAVDAALSANSDSIIYLSTFSSPGNRFYQYATEGKIPVFRFSWRDDPRKDDDWYETQVATRDRVYVARDIDCDPHASLSGAIFQSDWIEACIQMHELHKGVKKYPVYAGYDPAGSGTCESVICMRSGPLVVSIDAWKHSDPTISAQKAADILASPDVDGCMYDADGGWGEVARSVFASRKYRNISGFHGNGKAPDRFVNARAKWYWDLRVRAEKTYEAWMGARAYSPDHLYIPRDPILIRQLLSIRSEETDSGKIKIVSKADMARSGQASPDRADAMMLSFAYSPAQVKCA